MLDEPRDAADSPPRSPGHDAARRRLLRLGSWFPPSLVSLAALASVRLAAVGGEISISSSVSQTISS